MTAVIRAKFETWLKKSPVRASDLKESERVFVAKERAYPVSRVLDRVGLHTRVELDYGAGHWWLFDPHWDMSSLSKPSVVTAIFTTPAFRSQYLIDGKLQFFRGGLLELTVIASSGAPGYQYRGAEKIRGRGLIPESRMWHINTRGYWLDTRGIEGMFYHITPDPFRGDGFVRAELGLHRDANVPGSAGCIVVRDSKIFNNRVVPFLAGLSREQQSINLAVEYD